MQQKLFRKMCFKSELLLLALEVRGVLQTLEQLQVAVAVGMPKLLLM
jgi:hypothetical protein